MQCRYTEAPNTPPYCFGHAPRISHQPGRPAPRAAAMITEEQVADFERDGAVVIDGPCIHQPGMLDYMEVGWNRLHDDAGVSKTAQEAYEQQASIDCISNPFFEGVATRVLRAEEVGLFWGLTGSSLHARPPHQGP